jgi:hypothetical protein
MFGENVNTIDNNVGIHSYSSSDTDLEVNTDNIKYMSMSWNQHL